MKKTLIVLTLAGAAALAWPWVKDHIHWWDHDCEGCEVIVPPCPTCPPDQPPAEVPSESAPSASDPMPGAPGSKPLPAVPDRTPPRVDPNAVEAAPQEEGVTLAPVPPPMKSAVKPPEPVDAEALLRDAEARYRAVNQQIDAMVKEKK